MGAIMESIFCIAYLVITALLGCAILVRAKGDKNRLLFGILTLTLVSGDSFHLVPRIKGGLTGTIGAKTGELGFGLLVTSITMTVFYVMLYHYWCMRYNKPVKSGRTIAVYLLTASRIALCLFPQNDWFSADAPLAWGIYRNIPFAILGGLIVYLFYTEAWKKDRSFNLAWLAVLLSFLFYIPVIFLADTIPAIGMLMIPKTACYVWLIVMGYRDKNTPINAKVRA